MRRFSVEEANRLIGLLTEAFDRVRPVLAEALELQRELDAREELIGQTSAEVESLRGRRDEKVERIRAELDRLQEMGLEVKAADGLVDFPATLDGQTVYLCWKYGEPEITHWHELEVGFAGRKPIRDAKDFAPTYLC